MNTATFVNSLNMIDETFVIRVDQQVIQTFFMNGLNMIAFIGMVETALILGLVFLVAVLFVLRMSRGDSRPQHRRVEPDETRLIQEMHQSLNRLENRIEALETILIETERRKENPHEYTPRD